MKVVIAKDLAWMAGRVTVPEYGSEQWCQLVRACLAKSQKAVHILRTWLAEMPPGDDRAPLQRELRRHRREERALQRVLQMTLAGEAPSDEEFIARHNELTRAMASVRNSPDAASIWAFREPTLN